MGQLTCSEEAVNNAIAELPAGHRGKRVRPAFKLPGIRLAFGPDWAHIPNITGHVHTIGVGG